MKKKLIILATLAIIICGYVIYDNSQPKLAITVTNQTDLLLTHVRLESGPEHKKSETIPLAPTETLSWNLRSKQKNYVRLHYQTEQQRTNDVVISGYLESHTTGQIDAVIYGKAGEYQVIVNQSIRH